MTRAETIGYVLKAIDAMDNMSAALRKTETPTDYTQEVALDVRSRLWSIMSVLVNRERGDSIAKDTT